MFRKVQLKFFGIIIVILITIFICVLSSINIIMDVIMERQTKIVLQQVAIGVEYDEVNQTFTFTNPDKNKRPIEKENKKPLVTKAAVTTTASVDEPTETVPVTQKPVVTSAPAVRTQPVVVYTTAAAATRKPEIVRTEPPTKPHQATPDEPVKTEPVKPTEPAPPQETYPPFDWGNMQPPGNWDPSQWNWEEYWKFWDEWYKQNGGQMPYGQSASDNSGTVMPLADSSFMPVLDGYTILTVTDKKDISSEPPKDNVRVDEKSEPVPKSLGSIEFFVIMADKKGKYTASANNDAMTAEMAQQYIDVIMNAEESVGMTGNMGYCAEKKPNGTLMVLTDRTSELYMMKKLKRITLVVGIISIIFISAAAYFLSGIIVSPLKVTFEKQKQFISDASHELKTPLTVISTNADVLEGEIGENKWLKYIQDQADRMNVLVNDLLSLSRLENNKRDFPRGVFNLSRAITNAALPFECQAFETNKNFVLNIDEDIYLNASEQHIKQMAGIFIDNALKYSKDGGTVRVSLTKSDNRAVLSVYNTGSGVREEDVDKLFERFYRSDESRARTTGGYGLGLAIAKSIIDKHKFKVHIENQEGKSICFVVTM